MVPADTTRHALTVQLRMLDAPTGAERLRMAIEMSDLVKRLKLSALRSENRGISEAELKKLVLKSCFSLEELPQILR